MVLTNFSFEKGLVLGKDILHSLWKLPSCSIGMDISNPGEEQLHILMFGRSGTFLILRASLTWFVDTQKLIRQSKMDFVDCLVFFLRKLLEPDSFLSAVLYYICSPCHFRAQKKYSFRWNVQMSWNACFKRRHFLCDWGTYFNSCRKSREAPLWTSIFAW